MGKISKNNIGIGMVVLPIFVIICVLFYVVCEAVGITGSVILIVVLAWFGTAICLIDGE